MIAVQFVGCFVWSTCCNNRQHSGRSVRSRHRYHRHLYSSATCSSQSAGSHTVEAEHTTCQASFPSTLLAVVQSGMTLLCFYRAAFNAGRSSYEIGVCLSVCPSVKRVNCDKTEEKSVNTLPPSPQPFWCKSHFAWRKSATKILCVKTVSDKVVKHSLA